MSVSSVLCCSLLSAVFALMLVSAAGCGTDAKGVDECREIEQARCAAAQNCGVSDVPACQRFYRDQCLHGLTLASPGSVKVKACVATIRAAGQCAAQAPNASLDGCGTVKEACAIVNNPETTADCAFLSANADAGAGGSGGESAAAGSSGSASAEDTAGAAGI
jgi:hypothetical protein